MRYLILLALLCSCSSPPIEPPIIQPPSKEITNKDRVEDAWKYEENNIIITALEKADIKSWKLVKSIALIDNFDLDIRPIRLSSYFSRASLLFDGTLFLDYDERIVSGDHKTRLTILYNKVVNAK